MYPIFKNRMPYRFLWFTSRDNCTHLVMAKHLDTMMCWSVSMCMHISQEYNHSMYMHLTCYILLNLFYLYWSEQYG